MSASTAQIDANRANAQRSTGPVTQEGKAVSSRNATRHGFLATILPAEQDDYRALLEDLVDDLQPANTLQRLLVEEITLGYIRLRRIHAAEMNRMEPRDVTSEGWSHDRGRFVEVERMPGASPYDYLRDKQAHLVLRYEAHIERHIQRCLTRLKEMKGDPTWKSVARAAAQARTPESPNTDGPLPGETVASPPARPPLLTELLADVRHERIAEERDLRHDNAMAKSQNGFVSQDNDSQPHSDQIGSVSQNHNGRSASSVRRRDRRR